MKPVVLCILDGVGLREEEYGNAFKEANTPNFDYLWNNYPHCMLEASGEYVGIPAGQMGSSEVGHTNIGAGRIVYQNYVRINNSINDGTFYNNSSFLGAIENCKKNNSNLHILGLVSDGGIHSHINHLFALLDLCKRENFTRVYIHALLDGRDTEPLVAPKYIKALQEKIDSIGIGKIITIGGRYYAMNRDRNWKLTEMAYNVIVNSSGDIMVKDFNEAFEKEYSENLTDEFMKPTIIDKVPINDYDSLITFNFRSDRMIQFLRVLKDPEFNEFKITKKKIYLVTMTEYEENKNFEDVYIAYPRILLNNTLGEYLSNVGKKQLRLTEFEKSQHVTFYFSGCNDNIFNNEDIKIFERPNVFTYDEDPKMRCYDITNELLNSINKYDFIVLNYPNGDALGHTGIYEKTIEGIVDLDICFGILKDKLNLDVVTLIITADHGNCEIMYDDNGMPNKKHTTSKVPFIIAKKDVQLDPYYVGKLADIAPTILKLMNLSIPKEMTGNVLIK